MDHDSDAQVQKQLDAAMPWVGLYITVASAVCTLAMAADAFNGFRRKKLWFPCKYFSLNATSLTLLAVAMKLPMDLNTIMIKSETDVVAKFASLTFMSAAMSNFMSSLGSMSDKEIFGSVVALGILVFTIMGNVCIQLIQLRHFLKLETTVLVIIVPSILMLFSYATLVSLAITVSTTKRSLESKYQAKHKVAFGGEEVLQRREAFKIEDQRGYMMKYLVMAETSSPQFVMARSVVCTSSGMISFFVAIILTTVHILIGTKTTARGESSYGNYTKWILDVQSIGEAVGIIAPTLRWFVVVTFRCPVISWNSFKKGFKNETYWIQTLVEWRESLQIGQNRCRKYLHEVKWCILTCCIRTQILIVLVSKILVFLSALHISPFLLCFTHIKKFVKQTGHLSDGDIELNLSCYVLLLEGEAELPRRFWQNICLEADHMIQTGRKKQPRSLVNLLHKFVNFNGVGQFDSNQIPSLHSQEPSNCWTLPVVTLTSIAIALPNIAKHKLKRLLSSSSEGIFLARNVEKTLNKRTELKKIRKAADVTWAGVILYMKWLEIDLRRIRLKSKNSKEVLQELSNKAEGIIMEFKKEMQDPIMQNPLNWPAKIVAANSMYRISRTMLLSCGEENKHTDDKLFEQLSVMIADILAACLTNLPHAITTMCHHNAIEKREKSVRKAFLLLGKTEQVVELLQQQEWPISLDHYKAAYIEEWRALFQQDKDDPAASTSSYESVASTPVSRSEEYFAITIDC